MRDIKTRYKYISNKSIDFATLYNYMRRDVIIPIVRSAYDLRIGVKKTY